MMTLFLSTIACCLPFTCISCMLNYQRQHEKQLMNQKTKQLVNQKSNNQTTKDVYINVQDLYNQQDEDEEEEITNGDVNEFEPIPQYDHEDLVIVKRNIDHAGDTSDSDWDHIV